MRSVVVLLGIVAMLYSNPTAACLCRTDELTLLENVSKYSAVFRGVPVEMRIVEVPLSIVEGAAETNVLVRFRVFQSWKGVDERHVWVRTALFGPACGYGFRLGVPELVFASRQDDNVLGTSICTPTTNAWSPSDSEVTGLGDPIHSFKHDVSKSEYLGAPSE